MNLDWLADLKANGLTQVQGAAFAESAAYCLEKCGHARGVTLYVDGKWHLAYQVVWGRLPSNVADAHRDLTEATEYGAMGFAILIARDLLRFEVALRGRKGDGFD